jgi:Fis family transcriptional regulator, factor for inversion stimulation protein
MRPLAADTMSTTTLEDCVRETLAEYFRDLDGATPNAMHDMVLRTVEKPLLDVVMQRTQGNQSKAAEWLGINRNTLRRKLLEHQLLQ